MNVGGGRSSQCGHHECSPATVAQQASEARVKASLPLEQDRGRPMGFASCYPDGDPDGDPRHGSGTRLLVPTCSLGTWYLEGAP